MKIIKITKILLFIAAEIKLFCGKMDIFFFVCTLLLLWPYYELYMAVVIGCKYGKQGCRRYRIFMF